MKDNELPKPYNSQWNKLLISFRILSVLALSLFIFWAWQSEAKAVLDDNLVGYWNLTTNSNDDFGSNDGTDTNMSYSSEAVFNGSSAYINLASIPVSGNGNMTYNIWFKTSSASRQQVFTFGGDSTTNSGINGYVYNSDNKFYFQLPANGGRSSNSTVNDGNWHMVTLILTGGSTGKLFFDGSQAGSNFSATSYNIETAFHRIGLSEGGTYYFNGSMKYFGAWNKELSTDEITELYNTGTGLDYPFTDPVNGACGSNNAISTTTLETLDPNNCSVGTEDAFSFVTDVGWTWDCLGEAGGTTDSCNATYLGGESTSTPATTTIDGFGLWGAISTSTYALISSSGMPFWTIALGVLLAMCLLFFLIVGLSQPLKRLLK